MADQVKLVGLQAAIDCAEHIYYAKALNGAPAIRAVGFKYTGKEILQDLRFELVVTSVGQAISHTFMQRIPLLKDELVIPVKVNWDAGALMSIMDTQPADIEIRIFEGEVMLHADAFPVEVASPSHWHAERLSDYAVIPAFIQPNHPALLPVLDKAIQLLGERGHTPNFSGYQDPSHIQPMIEALWDATQSFGLTYSNPPASWDLNGQKIRNPQEVLETKYATCLDSSVLFASLLENVGLAPAIAVGPGHAWVGCWMIDPTSPDFPTLQSLEPLRDVIHFADLAQPALVFLESTQLPVVGEATNLEKSFVSGMGNVNDMAVGTSSEDSFFIDVVSARKLNSIARTLPMPARFVRQDGTVEVHEYKPADFTYNKLLDKLSKELKVGGGKLSVRSADYPPRLKIWLDSLLDLSMRNPLINFRNKTNSLPLIMAPGTAAVLEDLVSGGKPFSIEMLSPQLTKNMDVANERGLIAMGTADRGADIIASLINDGKVVARETDIIALIRRLRKMASNAKAIEEDSGSNGLHLALGELVWEPKGKGEIRSPLLLVPVRLKARNRSQEFSFSLDEGLVVTPNYSLVQKFKAEHQIDLTMLTELESDDSGINVPAVFEAIRQKIAEANLKGFRVDETATLGFFNFSSYRLWRDLIDNWQTFEKNPLVNHLIYTPNLPFEDKGGSASNIDLDELVAKLPIDADASQAEAVAKALDGKTFVLQGPPGTGKSQTITNILARALHEGKRVLFVAEKKDALDVVKDRLAKVGLGAFSLDLHDKAMSPKLVKQQLLNAVKQSTNSDVVGYETSLNAYDQSMRPLLDYRQRLHDRGHLGESIYSAIDNYLALPGDVEFAVPGEFIANATLELVAEIRDDFATIANVGTPAGTVKTNDWFISTLDDQPEELQRIIASKLTLLEQLFKGVKADAALIDYLHQAKTRDEFKASAVIGLPNLGGIEVAGATGDFAKNNRTHALESLDRLLALTADVPQDIRNLRLINPEIELGQVVAAQASSFVTKSSKLKAIMKRINIALGIELATNKDDLRPLVEKLVAISSAEKAALAELSRVQGIRVMPDENLLVPGTAATIRQSLENLDKLARFVGEGSEASSKLVASATANPGKYEKYQTFIQEVEYLFNMVRVTPETFERWQRGEAFGTRLVASLTAWITDAKEHSLVQLGRVVTLNALFAKLKQRGLGELATELSLGNVDYRDAETAFAKGYFKALASNLMVKQGFNTFDSSANTNFLTKLTSTKAQLQSQLPQILAAELGKRRGFDANAKVGAVGDLIQALNAKKSPPIRTMLAKHWDVISKLSPCVLASPDSTVRFIGADFKPFDLVVFDEASQIKVANAIGALGRGVSSIVVGDSKQMPPTSVAQSNSGSKGDEAESEDEEEVQGADAESILEQCTNARVPDVLLNWHYRSEDESLITFSNVKYYESRLNSFPNPSTERSTKGLSLVPVAGQFIRPKDNLPGAIGTNLKEAEAIVAEVARRAKDPVLKNDSLGIVTFNKAQQGLIEDLLFNSKDKGIQDALENGLGGEEILVKNLETVQGSERDVILFSVAFSRTPGGKRVPLTFGPLNNQGGERRLNVAVTRAKKQVIVFCSFDPQELKAQNPTAEGVANLADFLLLAQKGLDSQVMGVASELDIDRHRSRILKALTAAGLTAKEDVGLSGFKVDLAVFNPKDQTKAILGILLDGPRWNSRNTVNDRDLLPVAVLENKMGWTKIERIWLPAWLRDESGEIERIKAAFEEAKKVKPKPVEVKVMAKEPEPQEPPQEDELEAQDDQFAVQMAQFPNFTPAPVRLIGQQSDLDYLNQRSVQNAIRELAADITAFEGPVSPARLAAFVGSAFGFSRLTKPRVAGILSVGFIGHAVDQDGFIFPKGMKPSEYRDFKLGSTRHPDEISLAELANIMAAICNIAQGCREEQLLKVVTTTLGIARLTAQINVRLTQAIDLGLSTGRLVKQGEYLNATSN